MLYASVVKVEIYVAWIKRPEVWIVFFSVYFLKGHGHSHHEPDLLSR